MIPCSIFNQNGYTPLHVAAEKASVECMMELMQHTDIAAALIMQDKVSNSMLYVFDAVIKPYNINVLYITYL